MQTSSSEPVLRSEDYHLPCHGEGDTGHPKRVLMCFTSKDDGKNSSRINQIIKQAGKCPGPGKYMAHEEWKMGQTSKFAKSSRDYKPMHKGPSAVQYEVKDFATKHSIGAEDNVSNHRRTLFGKVTPGKRRSFLDGYEKHGKEVPGPIYDSPPGCSNRMPVKLSRTTDWKQEGKKTKSLKVKVAEIGPNHYTIDYSKAEPSSKTSTVPKEAGKNFIDMFVRETLSDAKNKKPMPGPGSYDMQNFDIDKTSRGTMHCQMRNITRNSASGYF
mmetsp:Transcript_103937/g.298696  ORF Transcript_103937/g.298696 Transcript_103937/m.298696 type:complete len:270 (-) Transcript_103937:82-891(-)